jgi:hypothetical protein
VKHGDGECSIAIGFETANRALLQDKEHSARRLGLKKRFPGLQFNTLLSLLSFSSASRQESGSCLKRSISEKKLTSVLGPDGTLHEQGFAGSGARFSRCHALITGLFTLNFVEQFTQPRAGFV